MTLFLQVLMVAVVAGVLLVALASVVGWWLGRSAPPPPFDRCDDPDCPGFEDEEVGR